MGNVNGNPSPKHKALLNTNALVFRFLRALLLTQGSTASRLSRLSVCPYFPPKIRLPCVRFSWTLPDLVLQPRPSPHSQAAPPSFAVLSSTVGCDLPCFTVFGSYCQLSFHSLFPVRLKKKDLTSRIQPVVPLLSDWNFLLSSLSPLTGRFKQ